MILYFMPIMVLAMMYTIFNRPIVARREGRVFRRAFVPSILVEGAIRVLGILVGRPMRRSGLANVGGVGRSETSFWRLRALEY